MCLAHGTELRVTVNAGGDEDDSGGYDEIGADLYAPSYYDIQFGLIPADGQSHTRTFIFDVTDVDLSGGADVCAGNGDGAGNASAPGFSGCEVYQPVPGCEIDAVPIPEGFALLALTCDSPIFQAPAGAVVEDAVVTAGQSWFMNPSPVAGPDGQNWTEIFVNEPITRYVPSTCVGGPVTVVAE